MKKEDIVSLYNVISRGNRMYLAQVKEHPLTDNADYNKGYTDALYRTLEALDLLIDDIAQGKVDNLLMDMFIAKETLDAIKESMDKNKECSGGCCGCGRNN